MAKPKDMWTSMRDLLGATPLPTPKVARLRPKPGGVATDQQQTTLPMTLTQMVRVSRADIGAELREAIEGGLSRVTIGIGDLCDIQLLDDDLLAADVSLRERELVVLTVGFSPSRGYSVSRGQANFGVYLDGEDKHDFYGQLHRYRQVGDLRPGDRVGMGSCPGDAVWFKLPAIRGVRLEPRRWSEHPVGGFKLRYQAQFSAALLHWRYPKISFGSDECQLIRMNEPELMGLKAVIRRKPDDPSHGYHLTVQSRAVPVTFCRGGYDRFELVPVGTGLKLRGLGNRLRFGDEHQVELPAPSLVTGRFAGRDMPTSDDIVAVFALHPDNLGEPVLVKARYRQLVRELHPDRAGDNEGHISRFLEVQACWTAYEQTYGAPTRGGAP